MYCHLVWEFLLLNKKLEQILSRVLPNHLPSIAVNSKDDRFNSWLLAFGLDCNTDVYSILEYIYQVSILFFYFIIIIITFFIFLFLFFLFYFIFFTFFSDGWLISGRGRLLLDPHLDLILLVSIPLRVEDLLIMYISVYINTFSLGSQYWLIN